MKMKPKTGEDSIGSVNILTPPCISLGLTRIHKRSSVPSCSKKSVDVYPADLSRPFSSPLLSKKAVAPAEQKTAWASSCSRLLAKYPLKIGLSTPSRKKLRKIPSLPIVSKSIVVESGPAEPDSFRGWDPNDADCIESEKRRSSFRQFLDRVNRVRGEVVDVPDVSCTDTIGFDACDKVESCSDAPESPIQLEEDHDKLELKKCRVVISRIRSPDEGAVENVKNEVSIRGIGRGEPPQSSSGIEFFVSN